MLAPLTTIYQSLKGEAPSYLKLMKGFLDRMKKYMRADEEDGEIS